MNIEKELADLQENILKITSLYGTIGNNQKRELQTSFNKIKAAISVTRCSLQLKDKYSDDFEYFVQNKVKEQKLNSIYWYNEISFFSLDSLFEYYQRMIKPLIV